VCVCLVWIQKQKNVIPAYPQSLSQKLKEKSSNTYMTVFAGKMYNRPQYDQICWEEDDFELPYGVKKMYHGTSEANARKIMRSGFKPSADGMLGRGVYLSRDLKKASHYPVEFPESDRVVLEVRVDLGNVIAINYQGHPRQKTWHDARHKEFFDTAWCPPNCGMTPSGLEEDCVRDPQRIEVVRCIKLSRRRGP